MIHDPVDTTTAQNFSEAIVVDPFDLTTLWAGTGSAGLFKSSDCGSTWHHINEGTNGASLDNGGIGSLAVDPQNQGVLYSTAFEGSNGLWKSVDGGVSWIQLFPAGSELSKVIPSLLVNSIAMDANDPRHLIVSMHDVCLAPYGPVCEAETKDGGNTWKITKVDIKGATYWLSGAGAFILGPDTWLFGTYSNGLWLTSDGGSTWSNVTPPGASGSTAGKTLVRPFLPNPIDGRYYLPAWEGILQSTGADGKQWTLIPNSGGRTVALTMGSGKIFTSDAWSPSYHLANQSDTSVWTPLPVPSYAPQDQGASYLAYDPVHHLLYSSNYADGLWRIVLP